MTTILQCRQINSVEVVSNGDYTCKFDKPLRLDPGDSVNVKSCFIDTKNQTTTDIVLDEDITATMYFGYYNTCHYPNFASNAMVSGAGLTIDGDKYIAFSNTSDPNNEYIHYSSITFKPSQPPNKNDWGDGTFEFSYTDTSNNIIDDKVNVPFFSVVQGNFPLPLSAEVKINIIALKDSLGNFKLSKSRNTQTPSINDFSGTPITKGAVYEPIINQVSITIPKGIYTPDDISQVLSGGFQKTSSIITSSSNISTNFLLTTLPELATLYATTAKPLAFINPDATNGAVALAAGALPALFSGTSTFSILYDNSTSKFKIDSCHNSIYDGEGNKIIKGIPIPPAPAVQVGSKLVTQSSGVYLLRVEPVSFWFNTLGFSNDNLVTIEPIAINVNGLNGTAFKFDNFDEGTHITGQYLGLDSLVPKGNNGATPPVKYDGTEMIFPIASIITTTNNPIIAGKASVGLGQSSGYYMVEVSGLPSLNDTVGETYNNSEIKAIVSRYYTVNSYTSAGGESDIPYTNISPAPVYINSLKIRILTPDGQIAEDIEADNTVFLQVSKQNMLTPYTLPQIKK